VPAVVLPVFGSMELAMGAASVAISRAGASSLAEIAAVRLPSILIPFPQAADDHQRHNARAFAETGAAVVMDQATTTPAMLIDAVAKLAGHEPLRLRMQTALQQWHRADAADDIARRVLAGAGIFHDPSVGGAPSADPEGAGKPVVERRPEAKDAA
jgi:UDP-N-acetylglucosamine--N-acetylmuramyl-(pentapeptide) pyrophosphoryl-undecaprenol N-acetylglucosamine transferase